MRRTSSSVSASLTPMRSYDCFAALAAALAAATAPAASTVLPATVLITNVMYRPH